MFMCVYNTPQYGFDMGNSVIGFCDTQWTNDLLSSGRGLGGYLNTQT